MAVGDSMESKSGPIQAPGRIGGFSVDDGIDIPDPGGKVGGHVSDADRESFSDDPGLTFMTEQLGEVGDLQRKRVRTWQGVAFIGWGVAVLFATLFFKLGLVVMGFRFPYVLASNGTVQLVSAWPEGAPGLGIQKYEKWVVEYMVRRFLEARYGASQYHARNIWPTFQAFWLRPSDIPAHNDYSQAALMECLKSDTYWQVVDRSILFDRVQPLPDGGGTLYDATVEFLIYQRKNVTDEVVKVQAYKARMRFTLGTPFGETDKARLDLWGKINPLHFTLVDTVESAPVTVSGVTDGTAAVAAPVSKGAAPSWGSTTVALPPPPPPAKPDGTQPR
jgi:hypothetical protein